MSENNLEVIQNISQNIATSTTHLKTYTELAL